MVSSLEQRFPNLRVILREDFNNYSTLNILYSGRTIHRDLAEERGHTLCVQFLSDPAKAYLEDRRLHNNASYTSRTNSPPTLLPPSLTGGGRGPGHADVHRGGRGPQSHKGEEEKGVQLSLKTKGIPHLQGNKHLSICIKKVVHISVCALVKWLTLCCVYLQEGFVAVK